MFAMGGYNWILSTLALSTVCILIHILSQIQFFIILSIIFILVVFFLLVFFRDPHRIIGKGIVSPADGKIISITYTNNDKLKNSNSKKKYNPTVRIAIFMSVINVHVNRAPITGKIIYMKHITGGFIPAYKLESKNNERMITILNSKVGKIKIIQIAGILAKRIVPYVKPGVRLIKGQRIGIIQFGSRVDLVLPTNKIKLNLKVGQNVLAGVTTVAEIKEQ